MKLRNLIIVAVLALLAGVAQAQFNGFVGIQSNPQTLFTNQNVNGTSPLINNFGQGAHFLLLCYNAAFQGTIDLEGTPDGTTWLTLVVGDYGVSSAAGCHVLQAGGYFNGGLRSVVTRTAGAISAWYSGVAAPIAAIPSGVNSTGPTPPIICDRGGISGATNGSFGIPANTAIVGNNVYVCGFTLSFAATPAAGTVLVGFSPNTSCTGLNQTWSLVTTTLTPQLIIVPIPQASIAGANAQNFCVVNNSGVSVTISATYASYRPL
jgi:hypothetical protein